MGGRHRIQRKLSINRDCCILVPIHRDLPRLSESAVFLSTTTDFNSFFTLSHERSQRSLVVIFVLHFSSAHAYPSPFSHSLSLHLFFPTPSIHAVTFCCHSLFLFFLWNSYYITYLFLFHLCFHYLLSTDILQSIAPLFFIP